MILEYLEYVMSMWIFFVLVFAVWSWGILIKSWLKGESPFK